MYMYVYVCVERERENKNNEKQRETQLRDKGTCLCRWCGLTGLGPLWHVQFEQTRNVFYPTLIRNLCKNNWYKRPRFCTSQMNTKIHANSTQVASSIQHDLTKPQRKQKTNHVLLGGWKCCYQVVLLRHLWPEWASEMLEFGEPRYWNSTATIPSPALSCGREESRMQVAHESSKVSLA